MATALLRLENLAKRYPDPAGGEKTVLQGVSLAVPDGAFIALVGASGCGKSTLLRHVAGLLPVSEGRVAWAGPIAPGDIGMVFQDATLMPWATIRDNVRLPLDLAGVARAEGDARVLDLLERVGLAEVADAHPRALSGGMRMRAAIARALITRPRILLMDEPFAALDEITRQKLNDDLLALWRGQGFTALFVTHSVYESVYLAQRVVVMAARPGRIHGEVAVDLPDPRPGDLRTDAAYAAICRDVSALLADAMRAGGTPGRAGGAGGKEGA